MARQALTEWLLETRRWADDKRMVAPTAPATSVISRQHHLRGRARRARATPPELAADTIDKDIILAGGAAPIKNLDVLLREETRRPIMIADILLMAVVVGSGKALDQIRVLSGITR